MIFIEDKKPELNIVLVKPRIAGNVGTISRLCYNLNYNLHLIGPHFLDFSSKKIMHAGLDYWPKLSPIFHENEQEFLRFVKGCNSQDYEASSLFFASTKAELDYKKASYPKHCFLIFGSESFGIEDSPMLKALQNEQNTICIPQIKEGRSLNLALAVAIIATRASA